MNRGLPEILKKKKKKQREKVRDSDMAQLSYLSEKGNQRKKKKKNRD